MGIYRIATTLACAFCILASSTQLFCFNLYPASSECECAVPTTAGIHYDSCLSTKPQMALFGFSGGASLTTIFSSAIDQVFFPGFTVGGVYHKEESLMEFRGRFSFGEVDSYFMELAGYRKASSGDKGWMVGGGIGFGGINKKELRIVEINGTPVTGTFYYNGKGIHAFLGIGVWLLKTPYMTAKADLDYFLSLYNVHKLYTPTGLRLGMSVALHTPNI